MTNRKRFKFLSQTDSADCGTACLRMLFRYHGFHISALEINNNCNFGKDGISMLNLGQTAEHYQFDYYISQLSFEELLSTKQKPCILHWNRDHYVVLIEYRGKKIKIADPAKGIVEYDHDQFLQFWSSNNQYSNHGIAMFLSPKNQFSPNKTETRNDNINWKEILGTIGSQPKAYFKIFLASLFLLIIQYYIPKLGASLIDNGIRTKNFNAIILILISQLLLIVTQAFAEFWKIINTNYLSVLVGKKMSLKFWHFLFKKPLSYFEARSSGKILGLLGDVKRIESVISIFFSLFVVGIVTILIYGIMLFNYSTKIFFVVLIFSALYFFWTFIFFKKIQSLDFEKFDLSNAENNKTIQLVQGAKDILLFGETSEFIKDWEGTREKVINVGYRSLKVEGYQRIGAMCIAQLRNLVVTLISANSVINGSMSIGELVAVQLIVGQLQVPIDGLFTFFKLKREGNSSLARVNEVFRDSTAEQTTEHKDINFQLGTIKFDKVSFKYPSSQSFAIEEITHEIENGKFTAIVGPSGCGKSTILKILGRYIENYDGYVHVGENDISKFNLSTWRKKVGFVSQENYLFDDTVIKNIKMNRHFVDRDLMEISKIPLGYQIETSNFNLLNNSIGFGGSRLSGGQRQRIIIARCLMYNPEILILDEATNSLDTISENKFYDQLFQFRKGKTLIVVAHRLSSIMKADKIIVMDKGQIVDFGNHKELLGRCSIYKQLFLTP